jgi:hypothetical protein
LIIEGARVCKNLNKKYSIFINGDTDGILLGAKITENGKLGPRFC